MNNSQIIKEEVLTPTEEREAFLIRIIETIQSVADSREWKLLVKEIFADVTASLERRLVAETKKPKIDEAEIYRLQGQLGWARKYSNLMDLQQAFKVELLNIKQRKHENH